MLNKITATVVVAIVVAAGILSVAYVEYNAHHLPIHSSNTVVNETVAENFLSTNGSNTSVYAFNATTSFMYNGISSSLSLKVRNFSFTYFVTGSPRPFVISAPFVIVTANVSQSLLPTDLLAIVSDYGPYNNSGVSGSQLRVGSLQPQSNVTPPNPDTFKQFEGNFSIHSYFKLINQTAGNRLYSFGLFFETEIDFVPYQNTIGTHVLHIVASLQGLGVPITTTINVLLIDKT